ncbi:MAG: sensor histidine kinase [Myxococcaceae bacterium]
MTSRPIEVAELGRAEPWLRALGLATWAFVGISRWSESPDVSWVAAWAVYGGAQLASAFHARLPRPLAVALLAVQSLAVVAMPYLGFRGFEGLLLAIVAAQVPTVLPQRAAWGWVAGQWFLLAAAVAPFTDSRARLDIFGAYSAFTAFTMFVYYLHAQERRARRAAAAAHAELLATRALLVEQIRQGERTALARELHDSLGHQLTALRIQLEVAAKTGGTLDQAQKIAGDAMGELRSVVSGQRQAPFALGEAIRALASGIPTPVIHFEGPAELEVADPAKAHAIFRAAQELITNAVKHAQAKNVWVTLMSTGVLELKVRDDGNGAAKLERGNGLQGLTERIQAVGGTVELSPQRGFPVHIKVPL